MSSLDAAGRFAVAQAVYNLANAATDKKSSDNLRAELDAETVELYRRFGAKNRDLRVGGTKVGTLSVVTESRPQVEDAELWKEWMLGTGRAEMRGEVVLDGLRPERRDDVLKAVWEVCPEAVHAVFTETVKDWGKGLVHDGCGRAVDEDGCLVPGVKWTERVKNTTVRGCEPEKVAAALHALPEAVDVFALLERPLEAEVVE